MPGGRQERERTQRQPRRASSTISTLEPYRAQVERWAAQDIGGVAIHAALAREQGYHDSYSSVLSTHIVEHFRRYYT
jgi:hypothetical protein